jgi:hypothetical protein
MRQVHRVGRTLVMLAILAVLSSCATAREVVESSGTPTRYLLCDRGGAPVPDPVQFRVGALGGRLNMGANELLIPPGALVREAVITLSEVRGDTVGVRIDGPEFTLPVRLTVSTARCGDVGTDWAIWRFRPGEPADRLRTRFDRNRGVAVTHFRLHSGFIIAGRDRT